MEKHQKVYGVLQESSSFPEGEDGGRALLPLQLYPVPVRVTNLRTSSGGEPNVNSAPTDESDDVLVRRFFLFEGATGRTGDTGTVADDVTVVRYASQVTLTFPTRPDNRGLLYPPVLTVSYAERRAELFGAEEGYEKAEVNFAVHYRADSSEFWTAAVAIFAVGQSLGLLVAVMRVMNWHGRGARSPMERAFGIGLVGRFLLYLAQSFAQATFWVLFILTGYWFIFFKLQARVFALLLESHPDYVDDDSSTLRAFLIAAFITHTFRLAEILYDQCTVDVFLVDWEKPRSSLTRTGVDFEAGMRAEVRDGAPAAVSGAGSGVATSQLYPPVSVWRTLFMANELSELAVLRRVSVPFSMMVIVVILEMDRLTNLATRQPDANDLTDGALDPTLIFFNAVVWFTFVVLPQYVLVQFVVEPYIDQNPASRLIDLCTVAKVSVLLLDDKYHGWYLHCDAPFEFADGDMRHLTQHLQDEEGNVRRGRGLIGSPESDAQSFELYLPEAWRRRYDEHYVRLRELEQHASEIGRVKGASSAASSSAAAPTQNRPRIGKRTLRDAQALNRELADARHEATVAIARFLKGFIVSDQMAGGIKRVFRSRTYCQRFFAMPPDLDAENAGVARGRDEGVAVLFHDREDGWERLLFRGVEFDLLLWILLVFCLVYVETQSSIAAALTATILDYALNEVRMRMGQTNIAAKTLVDERFLE